MRMCKHISWKYRSSIGSCTRLFWKPCYGKTRLYQSATCRPTGLILQEKDGKTGQTYLSRQFHVTYLQLHKSPNRPEFRHGILTVGLSFSYHDYSSVEPYWCWILLLNNVRHFSCFHCLHSASLFILFVKGRSPFHMKSLPDKRNV